MVTSELAKVEVVRAARRLDADVVPAARVLMSQLDLIPLSSGLLNEAADVGEPLLRTLDAIHLAGALSIQADLTAFVAYDLRLVAAAKAKPDKIDIALPSTTARLVFEHFQRGD